MDSSDEGEIIEFVVTGKDLTATDNKQAWAVIELDEYGELTGPTRAFKRRGLNLHVGGVYQMKVKRGEDGSMTYWPGTTQFLRPWENEEERLKWDARSRMYDVAIAADRKSKKDAERNLIRETLEPLRELWESTGGMNRRALEALVLRYLRSEE